MRAKFLKRVWVVILSACLVLSQAAVSFADTQSEMDPDDYLFLAVFRACGVSPGVDVGRWAGFYKGYLRSVGDVALLSRVEGYASLGWGDTAQGVDDVLKSVKGWLSLSGSYGTESALYSLPSSPSRQTGEVHDKNEQSVLTAPFSEITYSEPGYHYVFSKACLYSTTGTMRDNVYAQDGVEIVAYLSPFQDYYDSVRVNLCMVDDSAPAGYSSLQLTQKSSVVYYDGTVKVFSRVSRFRYFMVNAASALNLPFYVFNSAGDMENYCKTGVANNVFNKRSCVVSSLGKDGGLDPELQKTGIASIGPTMVLPKNQAEASSIVEAFQKPLSRDGLVSVLGRGGMDVVYNAEYKVEHLRERMVSGSGGVPGWEKYSEEVFSGAPGSPAVFTPLKLEGYSYIPELTEPEEKGVLADGSLVIRLYYTFDRAPYIVEHYTQRIAPGGGGEKWELADTETLQGIPSVDAEYSAKEYPGYSFDASLTEPSNCQVLPDGSLVIRLYYTCDTVPYKVEHYKENFSGDEKSWELADTETLQGIPGTEAKYSAKEYAGYSFNASLTEPSGCQVLPDGSLVIRLHYTRDPVPYKTEHYKERFSGDEKSWELADTEILQGIPGVDAKYSAKEYAGYSFDASLTEPSGCQVLPDGSLVIRLYYTCDPVPFTVEYYKESFVPSGDEKSWLLADTEALQGIPGVEAEYPVKKYPGYSFDSSLTEPSNCQVLPDGSLVIRLYYTQAPFSVLTEPVNKAAGSALPVAAVVGSVLSGGFFLLRLYKRVTAKA